MIDTAIIGTVALDSIKTPFGEVKEALGGSASYSSIAASFFSKPGIMSIIGKDFPKEHIEFFRKRGISTDAAASMWTQNSATDWLCSSASHCQYANQNVRHAGSC